MLLASLGIILGLILLTYGADQFVSGAASIAYNFGISPMIIGLTIVGFATSAPEILVGSVAALDGKTELAIGNALGSNITNVGLVLGLTALLMPITVKSVTLKYEYLLMMSACVIAFLLLMDLEMNEVDGLTMIISMFIIAFIIVQLGKRASKTDPLTAEFDQEFTDGMSNKKAFLLFLFGLALLLSGAELLVKNAVFIAQSFGISDLIIGLTIVAIGTSLPELAASIMSVIKKESDLAIGNIVGSNIFNMLMVLGIPAMIQPVQFDMIVLSRDFLTMFILTSLMGAMVFLHSSGKFSRGEGLILVLAFITYQYSLFITGIQN